MNVTIPVEEKFKFIIRVSITHVATYILCGILFSVLFDYQSSLTLNAANYMRDMNSIIVQMAPLFQVIRGTLFGVVFLIFKDSFLDKKLGWLRLWIILLVIGIVNTPSTSPFSIEEFIYYVPSQLSWNLKFGGLAEILTQTLLFSYLVTIKTSHGLMKSIGKNKKAIISAVITGVGFSLSGIVLAWIINVDYMKGSTDIFAFVIMFFAIVTVFFITKWYLTHRTKTATIIYLSICYVVIAIIPTIYNFSTNSPFKSYLSLIISGIPVFLIAFYHSKSISKMKKQSFSDPNH
ncbi:hypothetical protein KQI42_12595 [Tissierella sp. MSJ-40]|uniref:Uncharacterized protein n=1 Tax=Tissierella simiarum TaxID=2841534 RepID=A0ABS6E7G2_9FIRM|nr:hypothetical protein [Tissierella simiarum]MBU5438858.1 hypothetical protein [Tissierella simiarum]